MNMKLFFSNLEEPRQKAKTRHDLIEIIAMTIIAIAGDCDGWDEIEDFCTEHKEWFQEAVGMALENGIPSADTFERVWSRLDNKEFKKSFMQWAGSIRKKADYVIGLKGNQETLFEYATLLFSDFIQNPGLYEDVATVETFDLGHGRIEKRIYHLSTDLSGFEQKKLWTGPKAVGVVHSIITDKKTGAVTEFDRYYIASVTAVQTFAKAIREHWGIEASLHHVLDVSFHEDASGIHKDHAADNLAVIRHFALNALSFLDVGKKNVSARRKRKMCGRNPQLLLLALDKILSPKPAS